MDKYISDVNKLLQNPTLIKLTSFNMENLRQLKSLDNQYNININSESSKDKASIIIFLFNAVYINMTNVKKILGQDILAFLNKPEFKFAEQITASTNKFNEIKKIFNYTQVKNEYLFIKDWVNILKKCIQEKNNVAILTDIVAHHQKIVYKNYLNVCNELLVVLNNDTNLNFQSILNKILSEKINDSVLTYVKVRNDNDIYNKSRFNIKINQDMNSLLVKYNSDNKTYSDREVVEPKFYDSRYLFGKFTNIFLPCQQNKEVASKMQQVTKILQDGGDVFTYGYGSSGAGKTSSLIYFNKGKTVEERDGILIHLCNSLKSEYPEIEIRIEEYLVEGGIQKVVEKPAKNYLTFKNNGSIFELTEKYVHTNTHVYRTGDSQHVFEKGSSLGEIMSYMIDTDRLVKATTNNPNSSRSHVLVYVNFKGKAKTPILVVGDFAGVENAFDCDAKDIQKGFMTVKVDNGTEPFYNKFPEKIDSIEELIKPDIIQDSLVDKIKQRESLNITDIMVILEENFKEIFTEPLNETKDDIKTNSIKRCMRRLFNLNDHLEINVQGTTTDLKFAKGIAELNTLVNNSEFNKNVKGEYLVNKNGPENQWKKVKDLYTTQTKGNIVKEIPLALYQNERVNIKNLKTILEIIQYILYLNKIKTNYVKGVCAIRKSEGAMINDSLADLNNVIKQILIEKNKENTVNVAPSFIESCLPDYCTSDGCFTLEMPNNPVSKLVNGIKTEFKKYNKDFSKIILCVFCVFNISKKANNPPPVPFVDILEITKSINKNESLSITKPMELQINILLDKITGYRILNFKVNDQSVVVKKLDDHKKEIYKKNEIVVSLLKAENNYHLLKKLINQIDQFNAASAIGTLQTVDRINKYNTVNTICIPSTNDEDKIYNNDIINNNKCKK